MFSRKVVPQKLRESACINTHTYTRGRSHTVEMSKRSNYKLKLHLFFNLYKLRDIVGLQAALFYPYISKVIWQALRLNNC